MGGIIAVDPHEPLKGCFLRLVLFAGLVILPGLIILSGLVILPGFVILSGFVILPGLIILSGFVILCGLVLTFVRRVVAVAQFFGSTARRSAVAAAAVTVAGDRRSAAIFCLARKKILQGSREDVGDAGIALVDGNDPGVAVKLRHFFGELQDIGVCGVIRILYGVALRNDISDDREIVCTLHGFPGSHLSVASHPENRDLPLLLLGGRDKGLVVQSLSGFGGLDVADDGLCNCHGVGPSGCAVPEFEPGFAEGLFGIGCLCPVSFGRGLRVGFGLRVGLSLRIDLVLRVGLRGEGGLRGCDQGGGHDKGHASEQSPLNAEQFTFH